MKVEQRGFTRWNSFRPYGIETDGYIHSSLIKRTGNSGSLSVYWVKRDQLDDTCLLYYLTSYVL